MKKILLLLPLLLFGCKIEMESEITQSNLMALTDVPVAFSVEIPNCNDHTDSRKKSDSLIQAIDAFPTIMPNAVFKECYRKDFDSFAQFDLSVPIKDKEDPNFKDSIYFVNNANGLYFLFPKALNKKLEDYRKKEMGPKFNIGFELNYRNDAKDDQNLLVIGSYVDKEPVDYRLILVKVGKGVHIKLSNVLIDMSSEKGSAPIFLYKAP